MIRRGAPEVGATPSYFGDRKSKSKPASPPAPPAPNTPAAPERYNSNVVSIQRGSELDALKHHSKLIYDTKHSVNEMAELGPQAATVSPAILMHALVTNDSSDVGALEGAMVYEACRVENVGSEEARLDCVVDKAFANLGAMMASRVEGAVSVEVVENRRVAVDADAIVAKARRLHDMFRELGVDADRVLLKIPCTWEGIQAVARLEEDGARCHVTQVYCLEHAAAATRAGASVVQTYVGRVRTWYARHPVALAHNNLADAPDAGIELARQMCALFREEGRGTKLVAASVKNTRDALELAGCEYVLLNDRVIHNLNHARARAPVPNNFAKASCPKVGEITEKTFADAARNSPAAEETGHALAANAAADAKLKEWIKQKVLPGVGQ